MATRSLFLILNLVAQSLAAISSTPTLASPSPTLTAPTRPRQLHPRASSKPSNVPSIGFFDPRDDGGSFLTVAYLSLYRLNIIFVYNLTIFQTGREQYIPSRPRGTH